MSSAGHVPRVLTAKRVRETASPVCYANAEAQTSREAEDTGANGLRESSRLREVRLGELMSACYQFATESNPLPPARYPFSPPTAGETRVLAFGGRSAWIQATVKVRLASVLEFIVRSRED